MKTDYPTDNAAPCWSCQGTVATYTVDDATSLVDVHCHGCNRRDVFYVAYVGTCNNAAALSALHRAVSS